FPPCLRPPAVGQRWRADRLRLREWSAAPALGFVGVAQDGRSSAAQPPAPFVPRGVPSDAPRDAGRPRPHSDPPTGGSSNAGGAEGITAAAGASARPQAGARVREAIMSRVLQGVSFLTAMVLIAGVRFYQMCIRPILPAVCRFEPSCSEYFIQAVNKY